MYGPTCLPSLTQAPLSLSRSLSHPASSPPSPFTVESWENGCFPFLSPPLCPGCQGEIWASLSWKPDTQGVFRKKKKIHKGGQELCERMKLYFHQQQQAALSISELFSKKLVAVIFYFCFVAARSWQNIYTFGSTEEKRNNLMST